MCDHLENGNRLAESRGFPSIKPRKRIKLGEEFVLVGGGKMKIVSGKYGLELRKIKP